MLYSTSIADKCRKQCPVVWQLKCMCRPYEGPVNFNSILNSNRYHFFVSSSNSNTKVQFHFFKGGNLFCAWYCTSQNIFPETITLHQGFCSGLLDLKVCIRCVKSWSQCRPSLWTGGIAVSWSVIVIFRNSETTWSKKKLENVSLPPINCGCNF